MGAHPAHSSPFSRDQRVRIVAPGSVYDGCSGIVQENDSGGPGRRPRTRIHYKVLVGDAPEPWRGPAWFKEEELQDVE